MSIRSTVKAIILNNNKVLLNKCSDKYNGEYYVLPGGGQNTYETLNDAVIRECLEETGYTVYPIRFTALCEVICDDTGCRTQQPDYAHKMYHIFICGLKNNTKIPPTEIDNWQTGSAWIDISELHKIRLLPTALGENIQNVLAGVSPVFLGSEHIPYNHG